MITCKQGNLLDSIEEFHLDSVINAANGVGVMGSGIAGAIKKYGGRDIEDNAINVCMQANGFHAGDAYSTVPGNLANQGIKRVIHAVTMRTPGGHTSLTLVEEAFRNALKLAEKEGIQKIGCTALGTGVGGLDYSKVAEIMFKVATQFNWKIDIVFMDFNEEFITTLNWLQNSQLPTNESSWA
jgi:O-acetyl-ADP-ribose deacetylase (regulator of RNase III)